MALTMTRNRTQTALTKLAERLSNVKGELQFVEELLTQCPGHAADLAGRRELLLVQLEALCVTLRQFDASIDPDQVVSGSGWRRAYRVRTTRSLQAKYLEQLAFATLSPHPVAPLHAIKNAA